MRFAILSLFILILASCATTPPKNVPEHLTLTPVSFDDLDGWQQDSSAEALAAFLHSCDVLAKQSVAWQSACAAAPQTNDDAAARAYFEERFTPYAASGNDGADGLFTGYYVPELQGALERQGMFQTPLYARPNDMIAVDLGAFKTDLKGQHIVGKVAGNKLVPYDDRAEIAQGSLTNRAQPLVWISDPVGAFFLEVQGSGHIHLTDDSEISVGYEGSNGRAYVAIGRVLADRGDLPRPVTMPAIRAWLAAHPDQAQEIMNINPSYVFFRKLPTADVVGAEGVTLTARHSMAVDPKFIKLGTPVWLATTDGQGNPLHRLMVAQDTGGAIKGVVRGDVFWGSGDDAAAQAGAMQSRGRYYVLLPKGVNPDAN